MNEDLSYRTLLAEIKKCFHQNSKLVNTLVNLLCIEKEAVYRRLRDEVPFTFREIAIIAKELEISLDNIIGIVPQKSRSCYLRIPNFTNLQENDYIMLNSYLSFLKSIAGMNDTELAIASNVVPQNLFPVFDHLTKLLLFNWQYHYDNDKVKPFHDFIVPDKTILLLKNQCEIAKKMNVSYYILDSSIFHSLAKDIQYFKNIRLIGQEDVLKIKEDLFQFLNYLEALAINGKFKETGKKVDIYISDMDIANSCAYIRAQNVKFSLIKVFLLTFVTSVDEETFGNMKAWIQSTMKTSVLISATNEKQRIMYFEEQRSIVEKL